MSHIYRLCTCSGSDLLGCLVLHDIAHKVYPQYYIGINFMSNVISDVVDEGGGVACHLGRFCDEVIAPLHSVF